MLYFKMAEIGFCVDDNDNKIPAGEYLRLFQTDSREYESLNDRVKIVVQWSRPEELHEIQDKGSYAVCRYKDNIVVATHYGRCRYGILFKIDDWARGEILLQINPEISRKGFTLNQLLSMSGIHSAFINNNVVTLHASYIQTSEGAILFTAPSQTGKSTQAELWEHYTGAEIINGDRVLIRKQDSQWFAHGISVCGSSKICKNRKCLIRAIVVLEQGKQNTVLDLTQGEKYRALLLASAVYNWDAGQVDKVTQLIMQIIENVRIVKLVCRPDKDAVTTLKTYLNEVEENDC